MALLQLLILCIFSKTNIILILFVQVYIPVVDNDKMIFLCACEMFCHC